MAPQSEATFTLEDQALAVPEILESILLQLPLLDLLVNAQRVNHTWKRVIDSSPVIQQALFFQPATLSPNEKPHFNPLLEKAFRPWFPLEPEFSYGRGNMFEQLPWSKNQAAFSRKEASWRKMLPTQPAATNLKLISREYYPRSSTESVGEKRFEGGVRMGVLYDYAYKTVAEPISSFSMRWDMMPLPDSSANRNEDGGKVKVVDPPQIDLNTEERKEVEKHTITMLTRYTFQCVQGMGPDVRKEFRSQAFENLVVEIGESKRIR